MEIRIEILHRVSDSFGEPLDHLAHIVSQINKNSEADTIHFDFSQCKFTSPFILGGLASIISYLRIQGKEIKISDNLLLKTYLDTICFPDGYNATLADLSNLETKLLPFHSKSYIPVISFPATKLDSENKVREKTLSAVNTIIKNQLKLTGNVLQAIFYLIDELSQNVADHSNSDKGFVFAQFYQSKNYMDLCIVDSGKGLYQSYIDSGKHSPASDEEAIKFALEGKSTKNQAESRGFGIPSSRNMLVRSEN